MFNCIFRFMDNERYIVFRFTRKMSLGKRKLLTQIALPEIMKA